ncbi:hypothetical protein L1987_06132 [Smallanthus sonchifolius]|uniref:Uncharacterized protein n=1 Tax=Smallanthus sonchifolius TaxID=185202 RepID=A0ACB9JXG6_9ASTR|nr:hypothetical protein L1987_06132 [Smallanthus sonchifolius]
MCFHTAVCVILIAMIVNEGTSALSSKGDYVDDYLQDIQSSMIIVNRGYHHQGFRIPPVGWVFCCHSVCNRQEVGIIIIKYSPLVGYVALCGMPTHIALQAVDFCPFQRTLSSVSILYVFFLSRLILAAAAVALFLYKGGILATSSIVCIIIT